MAVRINQLSGIRHGANNEDFPIPHGYLGGQTMASAGESNAVAAKTRYVEVATTEDITIDGYGSGSVCWVFANTTAYFPAAEGQTFTWSAGAA